MYGIFRLAQAQVDRPANKETNTQTGEHNTYCYNNFAYSHRLSFHEGVQPDDNGDLSRIGFGGVTRVSRPGGQIAVPASSPGHLNIEIECSPLGRVGR